MSMSNPRKDDPDAKQTITLTPRAAAKLQEMIQQSGKPNLPLRLSVDSGGAHGMNYRMALVDNREEGDIAFSFGNEGGTSVGVADKGGEAVGRSGKARKVSEGNAEGTAETATTESSLETSGTGSVIKDGVLQSSSSISSPSSEYGTAQQHFLGSSPSNRPPLGGQGTSSSSSGFAPARQPFLGSSSSDTPRTGGQGLPLFIKKGPSPRKAFWEPVFDNEEISFLRIVGRTKTPIAAPEDIQLDSVDRHLDTLSHHGATMQVHRGTWKGRRVAFKYIRRGWLPDRSESETGDKSAPALAYRQDMYDLNFELQIMSKPTLRSHPNITQLLAVCFSTLPPTSEQSTPAFAEPGLIVELAHEQFPDLASFFNLNSNPSRPTRLPYETAASLISDIADGVQILHDHGLVHADLKPGNILLFPNSASRCGLTAKVADFGFVGMTTHTHDGRPAPLPDGRPRGGTPEWNAPECLQNSDPFDRRTSHSLDHPQYKPTRDIYVFGLLATYIALDGQSPKQYVDNLADVKLEGKMEEAAAARVEQYYNVTEADQEKSLKNAALSIIRSTVLLDPQTRTESLRSLNIRNLLFNDLTVPTRWPTEMFVLDSNLFPQSAQEFRCSGLYDAYWSCPPGFRKQVYASFKKLAHGPLGQYVPREVWALLEKPGA